MNTSETTKDLINYAKCLTNTEITELITELHKIQTSRADDKRRVAAKKVVEAIAEYLKLGEKIAISGKVYNKDYQKTEEITALFNGCHDFDGYLTFIFIQ